MKIKVMTLVLFFLVLLGLTACASNRNQSGASSSGIDVPDWYLNPPEDPGYIYGIGSAKMQDADRSRRASEHRARTSLSFQLTAIVRAMEVDYGMEGGTTNDVAVTQLWENIDRQLSAEALQGANIVRRYISSDGTHYALAGYQKNQGKTDIKGVIENAASRTATIRADAALKAMDAAFDQIGRPVPVETGE